LHLPPIFGWDTIPCMAAVGKFARGWINAEEWAIGRLEALATRLGRGSAMPAHLLAGLAGERAAYFELRRRGYKVVARRWTSARLRGEIDLIAWEGDTLCFVEVKTRTARDITPAESAIDDHKRDTLRAMARAYMRTLPEKDRSIIPVRFDVVAAYLLKGATELEIFPAAFC